MAGNWFAGEHEPIIARRIFEEVQRLLKTNSAGRRGRRRKVTPCSPACSLTIAAIA